MSAHANKGYFHGQRKESCATSSHASSVPTKVEKFLSMCCIRSLKCNTKSVDPKRPTVSGNRQTRADGRHFQGPAKSWLFVGFPYPHRPTHIEAGSHRLNALGVEDGRCLRVRLAGEARDTKYTFLLVRVLACFCGAVLVWALR